MKEFAKTEELYKLFINCNQKVSTDTRKIEIGSIFFALKGDNFDANTFALKAIEKGCRYAIVDDVSLYNGTTVFVVEDVLLALQDLAKHHRKQLTIPIIGITGSNGKTTNKELIHAVLSKKYKTYATFGNLNNHIGVPLTLLQITTNHEIAIVEMGANHQGEIEMLCSICDPDFGLITNIGKAHLEGFGGEEGVKKGKSELYKHLRNKNGKVFINGNDSVLIDLAIGIEKIYYGEDESFDVHGKLIPSNEYVEFIWNTKDQSLDNRPLIKTNLFGHYNFINVLCATCIGNYFKVDEELINDALSSYLPEMNRSQVKKTNSNTLILDAYNANPSSMLLAIRHFAKQSFKNKYIVLGDMFELGEYSINEHQIILDELITYKEITCVLIGTHFYDFRNKYLGFSFYKELDDAIAFFVKHPLTETNLLIKGSRGIKLEKLVDYL
jgi:UDP-N-acetylmuramoyl-tripeptide--D-alanyl-D-alanine ligase